MRSICLVVTFLGTSLLAGSAWSQKPLERDEAMQILAASERWVEIEGEFQANGSFVAKEIDIVALGDSASMEDMEISGVITDLAPNQKAMTVLGYRIYWEEDTKFTDEYKEKIDPKVLEVGAGVKTSGNLQENGSFLASKIRLREGKVKGNEVKYKEELLGPVRVIDAAAGKLLFVRTPVRLRPDCRFFVLAPEVD
jgi:hypothetical protein